MFLLSFSLLPPWTPWWMPPFHSHPFQTACRFWVLGASLAVIQHHAFKDPSRLPTSKPVWALGGCAGQRVLQYSFPKCLVAKNTSPPSSVVWMTLSLVQHIRHVLIIARCYQVLEWKHSKDTKPSKKNYLPQRDCTDIIISAHFYNLLCYEEPCFHETRPLQKLCGATILL